MVCFSNPTLFVAPLGGTNYWPLEFLAETYPQKLEAWGYSRPIWWKFHSPNFNRFWL